MHIFINLILLKHLWFDQIIFQNDGVKKDAFTPSKNKNSGSWKIRIAIFGDKIVFFFVKCSDDYMNQIIMKLLKDNEEMKQMIIEQNKKIKSCCDEGVTISVNKNI